MGYWDDIRTAASDKMMKKSKINYKIDTLESAQKIKDYISEPDRREKIGRIITNLGKFAFHSAVNDSLKSVRGATQIYKIVQEGLKDQAPACTNDDKKPDPLSMEEMEARLLRMQEELNTIKAKTQTAEAHAENTDHPKKVPSDPINGSDLPPAEKKRVFIRSRL